MRELLCVVALTVVSVAAQEEQRPELNGTLKSVSSNLNIALNSVYNIAYLSKHSNLPTPILNQMTLSWFQQYCFGLSAVSAIGSLANVLHSPDLNITEAENKTQEYQPYFESLQHLHGFMINASDFVKFRFAKARIRVLDRVSRDKQQAIDNAFGKLSGVASKSMPVGLTENKTNNEHYIPIEQHRNTVNMLTDPKSYNGLLNLCYLFADPYQIGLKLIRATMISVYDGYSLLEIYARVLDVKFVESLEFVIALSVTITRVLYKIALCNGLQRKSSTESTDLLLYLGRMASDVILSMYESLYETYEMYHVSIGCDKNAADSPDFPDIDPCAISSCPANGGTCGVTKDPSYPFRAAEHSGEAKQCVMQYEIGLSQLGVLSTDPTLRGRQKNSNFVTSRIYTRVMNVSFPIDSTNALLYKLTEVEPVDRNKHSGDPDDSTDKRHDLTCEEMKQLIFTGSSSLKRESSIEFDSFNLTHEQDVRAYKMMVIHKELPVNINVMQTRVQNPEWSFQDQCKEAQRTLKAKLFKKSDEIQKAVYKHVGDNNFKFSPSILQIIGDASVYGLLPDLTNVVLKWIKDLRISKLRQFGDHRTFESEVQDYNCDYLDKATIQLLLDYWNSAIDGCKYEKCDPNPDHPKNKTEICKWKKCLEPGPEIRPLKFKEGDPPKPEFCYNDEKEEHIMTGVYQRKDESDVLVGLKGLFRVQFKHEAKGYCGPSESVTLKFILNNVFIRHSGIINPGLFTDVGNLFTESSAKEYERSLRSANQVIYDIRESKRTAKEENKLALYIGAGVGGGLGFLILILLIVGAAFLIRRRKHSEHSDVDESSTSDVPKVMKKTTSNRQQQYETVEKVVSKDKTAKKTTKVTEVSKVRAKTPTSARRQSVDKQATKDRRTSETPVALGAAIKKSKTKSRKQSVDNQAKDRRGSETPKALGAAVQDRRGSETPVVLGAALKKPKTKSRKQSVDKQARRGSTKPKDVKAAAAGAKKSKGKKSKERKQSVDQGRDKQRGKKKAEKLIKRKDSVSASLKTGKSESAKLMDAQRRPSVKAESMHGALPQKRRGSDANRRGSDANRRGSDANRRASDANRRASDANRRASLVNPSLVKAAMVKGPNKAKK